MILTPAEQRILQLPEDFILEYTWCDTYGKPHDAKMEVRHLQKWVMNKSTITLEEWATITILLNLPEIPEDM